MSAHSRRLRLVLVEDNAADVYVIRTALADAGLQFDLVHYESADEALRELTPGPKIEVQRPDVALLDVQLPGRGGLSVLAALRADERLAHIPVVVLSGSQRERILDDFSAADAFVHKSMDVDQYMRDVADTVQVLAHAAEETSPGQNGRS